MAVPGIKDRKLLVEAAPTYSLGPYFISHNNNESPPMILGIIDR